VTTFFSFAFGCAGKLPLDQRASSSGCAKGLALVRAEGEHRERSLPWGGGGIDYDEYAGRGYSYRREEVLESMLSVRSAPLPPDALLASYSSSGAYTDCYSVQLDRPASLGDFMAAFYTTGIFKLERWLLTSRFPSSDKEAESLARGEVTRFCAWHVEDRRADQAVLAAGRTRSWLMVAPSGESTTLFFGSAIVPRRRGGLGWQFTILMGFHKLYSRILLRAAARRLASQ
jgi:hypothetical protein